MELVPSIHKVLWQINSNKKDTNTNTRAKEQGIQNRNLEWLTGMEKSSDSLLIIEMPNLNSNGTWKWPKCPLVEERI